jgi:hypothetical protein
MAGMRTVSADSHVVEPPNLWPDHNESALRDPSPHVEHQSDGDVYVCEGVHLLPIAVFAAVGKPTVGVHTKVRFEKYIRPGAYEPRALTFMEDAVALRNRDLIGVDRRTWASDYPHREGTFPHSREVLAEMLKDVPPEERAQIAAGTAARLYGV